MTYGTTWNRRLVRVKMKGNVRSESPRRRRSISGEASYLEFDLTVLLPYHILHTWADFEAGRRQELEQLNIDVMGIWEVKEWLQVRVQEAVGRRLRIGDQVKFDNEDEWFLLGRRAHDVGIFNSVVTEKFNLLRSNKP